MRSYISTLFVFIVVIALNEGIDRQKTKHGRKLKLEKANQTKRNQAKSKVKQSEPESTTH